MSTAVTPVETQSPAPVRAANPLDASSVEFREALNRRGENRKALIEWVRSSLVDGVDFGGVPLRRGGFSKPSLRKPGAEKICGMLGITATFPTLKDYEAAAIEGRNVQQIILRCHLIGPDGQVVADGVGARSVEQDHGDINKSLKMAVKSAMIDATLRMAGLSEIFTQDLEDMPHGSFDQGEGAEASTGASGGEPTAQAAQQPHGASRASGHGSQQHARGSWTNTERLATERQVRLIRVKLDQMRIPHQEFLDKFGIPDISALPFSRVNEALDWIMGVAA
ncbi:MAG TPA: hypothetical protein VJ011_09830 [Steroidobacteraceae bacterium]|nr:hypothetical protein [Steroidobacteraceae bacterium]